MSHRRGANQYRAGGVQQDFVGSVSALLKVRQGTVSLKHRVVELNEDVQKSGGGVADKVSFAPVQPRLRAPSHSVQARSC